MWHVEGTEVDILFVSRLDFGPNNFAISGQLWLNISDEAFSGCNKYTPSRANRSIIPMNGVFRRKDFAGLDSVFSWVLSWFNSSEPRFCSTNQIRFSIVKCSGKLSFVCADITAIHSE